MSHRVSVIRLRAMAAYRDHDEIAPSHSMISSATSNVAEDGRLRRSPHSAIQDQVRRCEIEQIMQTDPRRYWSDARLQQELFSLIERAP